MSAHSALEEPGSQQHLVTNTREVTLVTSRNALVPQATSSLPFPSPAAERGDVTLRESASESASGTAAIVDAQPTALVADSLDSEHLETHPGVLDGRMRPAAGQSVDVSCPSPGTAASPGVSQSALDASSTQEPHGDEMEDVMVTRPSLLRWGWDSLSLDGLPNEVLMHILTFLDVSDLLATSRINHHFRTLCLHPILHTLRLRRARVSLPPLLTSPSRPTLAELIARHIFLTHTTQISRRLARNLVAIRLSRRLPLRPSAESLVQRGVLPPEIVEGNVAPGLVAKKRAVEKERLKDGLRRWVGAVWRGEVRERSEGVKKWEERAGVGRVWRLRRFWERVGKDSDDAPGVM